MRCNGSGWILMHGMACIDRPAALWNGFGRVHHKPMGQPFQIFPARLFATKVGQHMGCLGLHLWCWHWLALSSVDGLAEPDQKLQFRIFLEWLCPRLWWLTLLLRCCFWTRQARKASRRDKEDFHGGRPCGCNWEQATTLHLAIASWLRCSLNPQQALSLPI